MNRTDIAEYLGLSLCEIGQLRDVCPEAQLATATSNNVYVLTPPFGYLPDGDVVAAGKATNSK